MFAFERMFILFANDLSKTDS